MISNSSTPFEVLLSLTGDVDEELFIKHAYLSLLIKNVLFCKYLPDKVGKSVHSFVELAEYFESKGVELFINDFYNWVNNIQEIREDVFQALIDAKYESEDIFRVIYQDMVSPSTRHALGEFYTPPELARLMVDEVYQFGKITLDPACGSVTFLVEIINKIKNEGKDDKEIIKAINNLYGFDVNPIAVLVSKANILINLDEFPQTQLPVNIFLTDSLKSIEVNPQSSMEWGKFLTFPLGSFGELKINERFFQENTSVDPRNYLEDFAKYLRFIDECMTIENDHKKIINLFDIRFKDSWLNNPIPGSLNNYRKNLHYLIKYITDLHQEKRNHIWLFLLYNSIGSRLIRNKVDLIIGNPPWVVLHSIFSKEYKEEIKNLAKNLDIMMGGKNASNTEMSSIFFCRCRDLYLKNKGQIFFAVTTGIMSGDQHSKFRRFKGFGNAKIWKFTQDVFKIHNICLFLEKSENVEIKKRVRVMVNEFECINDDSGIKFDKKDPIYYKPYNFENIKDDEDLVYRFIPEKHLDSLLPRKKSYYYDKFYAGARLGPRVLLLIDIN
ncbi:MAG: N-6 DNA methylase [Promethearchaeota archaeon]